MTRKQKDKKKKKEKVKHDKLPPFSLSKESQLIS